MKLSDAMVEGLREITEYFEETGNESVTCESLKMSLATAKALERRNLIKAVDPETLERDNAAYWTQWELLVPMVTFLEYEMNDAEIKENHGNRFLIYPKTVPIRCNPDYAIRNENVLLNKNLCSHCDGTGNEFFNMYHKCPECSGTGVDDG